MNDVQEGREIFRAGNCKNDPALYARLMATVSQMAQLYGANAKITQEDQKEISVLIRDHFSWVGINEIPTAFRLCYSGDLNINAEMYYGKFHAGTVGKILDAYRDYRAKVTRELEEAREDDRIADKERRKKEYIENNFMAIFNDAAKRAESWKDCFEHWYDELERRGFLKPSPDEKRAAYEKAKILELRLAEDAVQQSTDGIARQKNTIELKSLLDFGTKNAVTIAKKIIVFDYILKQRK